MNFPKILSTSKKIFWTAPQTHFQWIGLEKTDPKLKEVDDNRSSGTPELHKWYRNINPLYGWVSITFWSLIQWNLRRIGSEKSIQSRSALIEAGLWSAQLSSEYFLESRISKGSMEAAFSTWIGENYGRIGFENASTSFENASMRSVMYTHLIVESVPPSGFGCVHRATDQFSWPRIRFGPVVERLDGFWKPIRRDEMGFGNRSVGDWVVLSSETGFDDNTIISKASDMFGIQFDVHKRDHNGIDLF